MSRIRSCLSSESRDGGGRVEVGSEEGEREGEFGWERAILLFRGRVRVWERGKREGVAERRVRSDLKDERRSLTN